MFCKFALSENDAVICHVCHAAEGKFVPIGGKNCALV
jgi:hypothetical protein